MRKILLTSCMIAMFVGVFGAMAADPMGGVPILDRQFKGYQPLGFRLGKFAVYPSASIETGYTSNVLQTPDDEISDKVMSGTAGLSAHGGFNRLDVDIQGDISQVDYQDVDAFDHTDYGGNIRAYYDMSSTVDLSMEAGASRSNESRLENASLSGIYDPVEIDQHYIRGAVAYKSNDIRWIFKGGYRGINYSDTTLNNGSQTLVQRDRDRNIYTADIEVSHEGYTGENGSRFIPFLGLSYNRSVYDRRDYNATVGTFTGIDQNNTVYGAAVGVDIQPTGKLRGRASIGYGLNKPDDVTQDDKSDLTAKIDISYLYSPLTNFVFGVDRFFANDSQTSETSLETNLSAKVIHELTRQWVFDAGVTYTEREFADGLGDETWDFRTGVSYRLNKNVSIGGSVDFITRESGRTGGDYDDTRAMIRVNTKF